MQLKLSIQKYNAKNTQAKWENIDQVEWDFRRMVTVLISLE